MLSTQKNMLVTNDLVYMLEHQPAFCGQKVRIVWRKCAADNSSFIETMNPENFKNISD